MLLEGEQVGIGRTQDELELVRLFTQDTDCQLSSRILCGGDRKD